MNDDNVLKFDENLLPGLSSGTDKLQYRPTIKKHSPCWYWTNVIYDLLSIDPYSIAWSVFTACTSKCGIGKFTRSRQITIRPAHGGSPCPPLEESRQWDSANGGCDDVCNPADGSCSCVSLPGYKLEGKDYSVYHASSKQFLTFSSD